MLEAEAVWQRLDNNMHSVHVYEVRPQGED